MNENSPLYELDLTLRSYNALVDAHIHSIGDLCKLTKAELLGIRGIGIVSYFDVVERLHENGFFMKDDDGCPIVETIYEDCEEGE